MAFTFKGGLHIDDHKTTTNTNPIQKLPDCKEHIFPLQQHIGAAIEPLVKVGSIVKVGQKIADSDAFVSAPIHSSISGIVTAIKPCLHPSGAKVTSIVIENDLKYEKCETIKPHDIDKMSISDMLKVIKEAGIVGMGGAGFPTHVKLSPPKDKKITHIIVNGSECEPYLTSDHRRMLETPEEVLDGLKIAMKVLCLKEGYVGIEINKADAIDIMKKEADKLGNINIMPLKTKYPQGAEKQLIKAITKRTVPSGGLPADVGVIVINIDTATAISRAFRQGIPLIERIVTVSGDCIANPTNYSVPIGVPIKHIIESAGGFTDEPKKVILGGPMMGIAQYSLDTPIIKTSSAVLALKDAGYVYNDSSVCIRCGKCVDTCPMRLMPLYLNKYAKAGDLEMAEKYHILDCIECGICSYLCPGMQGPLQNIRSAKQQILENRRKK